MPPEPAQPKKMPFEKYRAFVPLELPDRTWPDRKLTEGADAGARSTCATATRR